MTTIDNLRKFPSGDELANKVVNGEMTIQEAAIEALKNADQVENEAEHIIAGFKNTAAEQTEDPWNDGIGNIVAAFRNRAE